MKILSPAWNIEPMTGGFKLTIFEILGIMGTFGVCANVTSMGSSDVAWSKIGRVQTQETGASRPFLVNEAQQALRACLA